jgi:hypothetical protein
MAALVPGIAGAAATDRPAEVLAAAPAPAKVRGTVPATVERSRFVSLDQGALGDAGVGDRVSFEVFAGEVYAGTVRSRSQDAGATTWSGGLAGRGTFDAARVGDTFHISLHTDAGAFDVSSAGGGTYRVVESAGGAVAEDDGVAVPARAAAAPQDSEETAGDEAGAADSGTVVDVLVVTTAQAEVAAGSAAALAAQVATGFSQANQSLANSGIPYTLRQAGIVTSATAETGGDLRTDLTRVRTPGDGYFEEAIPARDQTHADLVSLWIGGAPGGTCGRGYVAPTREEYGYSVVFAQGCATTNYSFVHEVGHNFGAEHDATASSAPSPESPAYARGHVDVAAKWFTIMAYDTACRAVGVNDCVRVPYFSNPGVSYGGRPTGNDAANNARVLGENFGSVANFRQEVINPGVPALVGAARFRSTVSVNAGSWLPANTSLSVQWFLDGAPVAGATSTSLRLSRSMIGKVVTAQVTGSAPYYSPVAASTPAYTVGKAVFRKKRVTLVGTARPGRVLTARTRIRPKAKKIGYRWYRNGKRIKGATKATYRVTRRDRGKKIQVKVIAHKKGYATLVKKSNKRKVR